MTNITLNVNKYSSAYFTSEVIKRTKRLKACCVGFLDRAIKSKSYSKLFIHLGILTKMLFRKLIDIFRMIRTSDYTYILSGNKYVIILSLQIIVFREQIPCF